MVADELGRFPIPFLEQKINHPFQRIDQQLIAVNRRFLHHGFADVEDVAGVHPVNAVQLNVFRRYFEDVLHRLFGFDHFLHQLEKSGIWTYLSHERRECYGGWFC